MRDLGPGMRLCPACGHETNEDMATCHLCEHEIEMARVEAPNKGSSGFIGVLVLVLILAAAAYLIIPRLTAGRGAAPVSRTASPGAGAERR